MFSSVIRCSGIVNFQFFRARKGNFRLRFDLFVGLVQRLDEVPGKEDPAILLPLLLQAAQPALCQHPQIRIDHAFGTLDERFHLRELQGVTPGIVFYEINKLLFIDPGAAMIERIEPQ